MSITYMRELAEQTWIRMALRLLGIMVALSPDSASHACSVLQDLLGGYRGRPSYRELNYNLQGTALEFMSMQGHYGQQYREIAQHLYLFWLRYLHERPDEPIVLRNMPTRAELDEWFEKMQGLLDEVSKQPLSLWSEVKKNETSQEPTQG